MNIKIKVSLFVLIIFICTSCDKQSPIVPDDSKTEYPDVRAGSDGINWEELISFPTNIGPTAIRTLDITADEIGNSVTGGTIIIIDIVSEYFDLISIGPKGSL